MEVLKQFEGQFECEVLEGYGLSETSPVASFNKPDDARKMGSIGTPVHGVEMQVIDDNGTEMAPGEVGELAIRGHNVMKGYWKRSEETRSAFTADGWFRTGDMGRMDDEGYFFIIDRKKDLVIRSGFNVYPREIEEVLYEHHAVAEAAVVGAQHQKLGEQVIAAVSLHPGSTTTDEELSDFLKDKIARYKHPDAIRVVDTLPKGATGKMQKRDLAHLNLDPPPE